MQEIQPLFLIVHNIFSLLAENSRNALVCFVHKNEIQFNI